MSESELQVLSSLPEDFLQCGSRDLYKVLGGPTLIHLPGNQPGPPLFICTLLHGNETTGIEALQIILECYGGCPPRPVSIFIGNVSAAQYGERFLSGQPDYNRIWTGGQGHEYRTARHVLELMKDLEVCACIDIHNNTGRNPHYAIIATRETPHLALACKFSDRVVYATYPDTSCSVAFSELCPSITVEAGVVGDASGVDHVLSFLGACFESDVWLEQDLHDIDLYHTVAVVRVREDCSIGLLGENTDVELLPDVDSFNFNMLQPGTKLGIARNGSGDCLTVQSDDPNIVLSDYLVTVDGELRTAKQIMPAMLTTDCDIIKMDCLCYLMERLG